MSQVVDVSIVVPVYNERESLEELQERLDLTLRSTGQAFEILYVDDGSTDGSAQVLRRLCEKYDQVKLIRFNRNYGQHAAVFAGLERARGEVVVTLDADLQNPPEEIPKLLARMDEGHDVVGGWRVQRQDGLIRRFCSLAMNAVTSRVLGARMRDYGCMLRAYRRGVVEKIRECQEISSFIPALAVMFAGSVSEVPVEHQARRAGRSKYHLFKLIRLNFDLMTGFSLLPIQVVSLAGIVIALVGVGFGGFLLFRRLFVGPEVEGVFTLFAILFGFVGIQILALGLIGEYIGRIYLEVRRRPRYVVEETHD